MSNRRRPSRGNTYRTGHLTSPQWFARRDRWFREQLQIAGEWTCVGGVRTADRRELELHHLSYDGVKKTPAGWYADEAHEDLWPLHPACHELLHRIIDRDPLLARHRTRRQASATALQIVRRKHTIRRGRRIMSDDFDDFTVDEAVAAMQAEIDAVWVVNWRELDDETAHDVWGDLREWVERFTVRYQVSPTVIPNCWWKHRWLVEELSALRNAHRALFDPHDTGLGPIGWHERYALAIERIKKASSSAGCTNGHQETRPIRDWSDATDETEWDQWITRSHG